LPPFFLLSMHLDVLPHRLVLDPAVQCVVVKLCLPHRFVLDPAIEGWACPTIPTCSLSSFRMSRSRPLSRGFARAVHGYEDERRAVRRHGKRDSILGSVCTTTGIDIKNSSSGITENWIRPKLWIRCYRREFSQAQYCILKIKQK